MGKIKTYAIVGCGGRALAMFARPLVEKFSRTAKLVGLCDINPGRLDLFNRKLKTNIPTFTKFEPMVEQTRPNVVIVCTKDVLHHKYIVKALKLGCDVISEKPMVINPSQCREVLKTEKQTGRKVTVTFNYRFSPYATKIREIVAKGIIGKIISADYNYLLDREHGADYFRRWHRRKEDSGGLLIHKSTHHFDFLNWVFDQQPETLFAFGSRQFYGPTRKKHGERCSTCDYAKECNFFIDIKSPKLRELYADNERFDGYQRDLCVFSKEIDIEDTMTAVIRYSKGTQLTYSLNAHCTYEGWRMILNGTEGRLEAEYWKKGPLVTNLPTIKIYRWKEKPEIIPIKTPAREHGGADPLLQARLFGPPKPDPMGLMASSRAGAYSILTGVAANKSIATGKPVKISSLLKL
jgi:predicted dehydrogenase